MDPFFKLPEEIHEDLLKYFSAREVLDVVSLVSKSWYSIVASSNVCMQKIRLNLKSNRKTNFSERIETLRWMSRKEARGYQHLQINCLLDEAISNEVWSFIDSLGNSVEVLNIRSMKLDQSLKKISLPNLEDLKMMFIPREAMNLLLASSQKFKVLTLRNEFPLCYDGIDYTPSQETVDCIRNLLTSNVKLEELELQGRPNFLSFFHENLTDSVRFSLKKFVVKIEMSTEKVLPEIEGNLLKFLTHQAGSLKHVYVDICGTNVIKHVFNAMPEVNFIRFDIEQREPNKLVIKDLDLTPNEKITHLELGYIAQFDDLKEFLELTPNVEEILIGHMIPKVLEYATKSLPKLKSIVYRYNDCAEVDRCYLNLIGENPNINQNIKLSICNDFL